MRSTLDDMQADRKPKASRASRNYLLCCALMARMARMARIVRSLLDGTERDLHVFPCVQEYRYLFFAVVLMGGTGTDYLSSTQPSVLYQPLHLPRSAPGNGHCTE